MHASLGSLLTALAATAVISAMAAGPATAETNQHGGRSLVHQVPKVPLVVDGVRYAPKQIHRFDGRPLYMRPSDDGKRLIAYTKLRDYRADLRTLGLTLPADPASAPAKARASGAGHWLKVCTGPTLDEACYTISSGMGVANFFPIPACWYGCFGGFVNSISSLQSSGQYSLVFDKPDFNRGGQAGYGGSIMTVPPNVTRTLSDWGWDNIIESGFTFW
jgi:hypothetical protein